MQVFIADKRGVSVVHKTGKVVAKLGQDLCSSSHSHLCTVNIVFGTAPSLMCSETFFPWVDHLGGGGGNTNPDADTRQDGVIFPLK